MRKCVLSATLISLAATFSVITPAEAQQYTVTLLNPVDGVVQAAPWFNKGKELEARSKAEDEQKKTS